MSRGKRTFATIEQRASGRWRVRYTGPTGAADRRRTPSRRGSARRRTWSRCAAASTATNGTPPTTTPPNTITSASTRHAGSRTARCRADPIKARTREHYQRDSRRPSVADVRQPAVRRDHAERCPGLVRGDTDRPADDALPRLQPAAHHHGVRGQRGIDRRQSVPHRRRRPGQAGPPIRPASWTNSRCSPPRCPSGCS